MIDNKKYFRQYTTPIIILVAVVAWIVMRSRTDNPDTPIRQQNVPEQHLATHNDLVADRLGLLEEMKKGDRNYDFKVPIEFYGMVLDQHDNPVMGAEIQLSSSSMSGILNQSIYSREDGAFSLTGLKGKFLSVNVFRLEGYTGVRSTGYRDYNYAIPGEFNFHVPNPNSPVIFRIWKYENPEPIQRKTIYSNVKTDGTVGWFDLTSGRAGIGGLGVSVVDHIPGNTKSSYVTYKVVSGEGCSIIETSDDPMYTAPDKGFKNEIIHEAHWTEGESSQTEYGKFRFYFRNADGSHAAVIAEIRFASDDKVDVTLLISLNPSGSRNLEYDPRLDIKEER